MREKYLIFVLLLQNMLICISNERVQKLMFIGAPKIDRTMDNLVFLNDNLKEKVSLCIVFIREKNSFRRMKAELMFVFFLSLYKRELFTVGYRCAK